jgi:(E)-4-hydroxy-3-methylbut-2-enyl-diphosphate synthase
MGCIVNGPGEASEADIGAAGGIGEAIIFKNGKTVMRIKEDEIKSILIDEIKKLASE